MEFYKYTFGILKRVLTKNYLSKDFQTKVEDSHETDWDINFKEEILENFGDNFSITPSQLNANFSDFSHETSNSHMYSNDSNSRKFSEDRPTSKKGPNLPPSPKCSSSPTFHSNPLGHSFPFSQNIFTDFNKMHTELSDSGSFQEDLELVQKPPTDDDSDLSFETLLRIEKQNLRGGNLM
jgi:hypothetical protein